MDRHFERWDYGAVQELERLCSTLPLLSRERAMAVFREAQKITADEGQPVERHSGKIFESMMGVVNASDRKDFTATWETASESVADGVLMVETYDAAIGALFCVVRISDNSFLTRAWTGEANKGALKRLQSRNAAPAADMRETPPQPPLESSQFKACPSCGKTSSRYGGHTTLNIFRCSCGKTYCDDCSAGGLVTLPRCPVSPYHENMKKIGAVQVPSSETNNLARWQASGQPRAWVDAHYGRVEPPGLA